MDMGMHWAGVKAQFTKLMLVYQILILEQYSNYCALFMVLGFNTSPISPL